MLCRKRKNWVFYMNGHSNLIHLIYSKEVASSLVGSDAQIPNGWIKSFQDTSHLPHVLQNIGNFKIYWFAEEVKNWDVPVCQIKTTKKIIFSAFVLAFIYECFLVWATHSKWNSLVMLWRWLGRGWPLSSFQLLPLPSNTSNAIHPRQVHPLSDWDQEPIYKCFAE